MIAQQGERASARAHVCVFAHITFTFMTKWSLSINNLYLYGTIVIVDTQKKTYSPNIWWPEWIEHTHILSFEIVRARIQFSFVWTISDKM